MGGKESVELEHAFLQFGTEWLIARRFQEMALRKGGGKWKGREARKGKQTNLRETGRIALTKGSFSRSITVFGLLTNLFSLALPL